MQNEDTAAGAGSPAVSRGRHILMLVVDGLASGVHAVLNAAMEAARTSDVDVAAAQSQGPIPATHPAAQLPVIQVAAQPATTPASSASSVLGDSSQGQQSVAADAQIQGAPVAPNSADNAASGGTGNGAPVSNGATEGQPGSAAQQQASQQPVQPAQERQPLNLVGEIVSAGMEALRVVGDHSQGVSTATAAAGSPAPAVASAVPSAPDAPPADLSAPVEPPPPAAALIQAQSAAASPTLITDFLASLRPQLEADANVLGLQIIQMLTQLVQPMEAAIASLIIAELQRVPVVSQMAAAVGVDIPATVNTAVQAGAAEIGSIAETEIARMLDHSPPPQPSAVNPNAR